MVKYILLICLVLNLITTFYIMKGLLRYEILYENEYGMGCNAIWRKFWIENALNIYKINPVKLVILLLLWILSIPAVLFSMILWIIRGCVRIKIYNIKIENEEAFDEELNPYEYKVRERRK